MSDIQNLLIRNGFVQIPAAESTDNNQEAVATVLMNLEYYGYGLSLEAYKALSLLSADALGVWWVHTEPELKKITGDNLNIDKFVVYKNFPKEVLNKTEAEYWIPQILMYWGLPAQLFAEAPEQRQDMNPKERHSKTLLLSKAGTCQAILNSLIGEKVAWKNWQFKDVLMLSQDQYLDFSKVQFKENLVKIAGEFVKNGAAIKLKNGTDVLRLAAGISDGDVSLRTKVKFKSFNRPTRRYFMTLLASCQHLEEDFARRKGVWKKFLHNIHPGEFQKSHAKVVKLCDELYNDRLVSFNSEVEKGILNKDLCVLKLLATRPGEFSRRLVHLLDVFGKDTISAFVRIIPKLTVYQMVSLRRVLETSVMRQYRVFPPRGNWGKLQIGTPRVANLQYIQDISVALGKELHSRVPMVSVLDPNTKKIKLPNGTDEGIHARGTVFKIPNDVTFVRTASYWRCKECRTVWFDNGWNFFDEDWKSVGAICWNMPQFPRKSNYAAVFSGDPVNTKDSEGRATQVIDLYLDKLKANGVHYAVWNVLCFSNIPFSKAEVFAGLQWGIDPQQGKIFEPSRCQLAFPLTGEYLSKYVCVIDLETKEMVYLDANLKAQPSSATSNGDTLSKQLPAFMDYLASLPTVHDLFRESVGEGGTGQVLHTVADNSVVIDPEQPTYIFDHQGEQDYKPMDLNKILSM